MINSASRIKSDPKIMFGKPVIAGTRITVEHILWRHAAGVWRPMTSSSTIHR